MREVVGRYFQRRIEEERPLPDLVLIDGGKGQLNAAAEALRGAGPGFTPDRQSRQARGGDLPARPLRVAAAVAPVARAAHAAAGARRGAPLRDHLPAQAAHGAHDHLRAAAHSRRRRQPSAGCCSPPSAACRRSVKRPRSRSARCPASRRRAARSILDALRPSDAIAPSTPSASRDSVATQPRPDCNEGRRRVHPHARRRSHRSPRSTEIRSVSNWHLECSACDYTGDGTRWPPCVRAAGSRSWCATTRPGRRATRSNRGGICGDTALCFRFATTSSPSRSVRVSLRCWNLRRSRVRSASPGCGSRTRERIRPRRSRRAA